MKQLRRTVLVILALSLCAVPAALAKEKQKGELVPPPQRTAGLTGGQLLGEAWVQFLAHPAGTFTGGCMPVTHKVVAPEVDFADGTAACTVRKGTTLMLFLGSECSDVEEPPFFGADEQEQRECAIAFDYEFFVSALVSLDGGPPVEQVAPVFERVSPQRTVELPDDNVLGVPAQTATFVAHGWVVLVRKLDVGHHVLSGSVTDSEGGTTPFEISVDVVKGR